METPIEFTYNTDRALARRAVRRYLARQEAVSIVMLLVLTVVGFFIFYQGGMRFDGVGTGAFLLGLFACTFLVRMGIGYLEADRFYRQVKEPAVTVHASEESLIFSYPDQRTELSWSRVVELWTFPDVWLVFLYQGDNYIAIPTEAASPEALAFIQARVVEAGGKVS